MALDDFRKHLADSADIVLDKARGAGSKAAEMVTSGARIVADGAQQVHHDLRMAYYSPVFPDEFNASTFDLPKMIVIEDEDHRKGIEILEGAIGWLSKKEGMEILHLYEEFIPDSHLNFVPFPSCDTVYYSDPFEDDRFIDLSIYYDIIKQDKLTELREVAYCLGAKECYLESYELDKSITRKRGSVSVKAKATPPAFKRIDASGGADASISSEKERSIVFKQAFEGSDEPRRPDLRWYKHDRGVCSLVEMCCSGERKTKSFTVDIDSTVSSTMSLTRACKLDVALKGLGAVCNFKLEDEARNESRRHLVYNLVF